jgi:hypothetical protein
VTECLRNKHEALNSKPSTSTKDAVLARCGDTHLQSQHSKPEAGESKDLPRLHIKTLVQKQI